MGILQLLKNKKKENIVKEDAADLGWKAIEGEFLRLYPGQTNPKHYGTVVSWNLGGNDPLDGISIYDGGDFWHFVGFGQTELYKKESENPECSGFGYELTFKLKKNAYADEESEIRNICGILQLLARITFTKNELFGPFEYIYTGQTTGIDARQQSKLTGFIFVPDSKAESIISPFGNISFLSVVGSTDAELKTLDTAASVQELYAKLGTDITDYGRESLV